MMESSDIEGSSDMSGYADPSDLVMMDIEDLVPEDELSSLIQEFNRRSYSLERTVAGCLSDAEAEDFPTALITAMPDELVAYMAANLTADHADNICWNILNYGSAGNIQKAEDNDMECLPIFMDSNITVEGTKAGVILDLLREDLAIASWDYNYWAAAFRALDAITPTDLDNIHFAYVFMLFQDGYSSADFASDQGSLNVINAKIEDTLGTPDTWNLTVIMGLECNLFYMAASRINLINATLLTNASTEQRDICYISDEINNVLREKAMELVPSDPSDWSSDDVEEFAWVVVESPSMINEMDPDTLSESVTAFAELVAGKRDGLALANTLMNSAAYSDATALDADAIGDLGSALSGFHKSYTDSLPAAALKEALPNLADCEFDKAQMRSMLQTMVDAGEIDYSTMDASDVGELAVLMEGASSSDLNELPAAVVLQSVSSFSELEMAPSQSRAIIDKITTAEGGSISAETVAQLGNLIQFVAPSQLGSLGAADLGLDCSDSDSGYNDVTTEMAGDFMNKIKDTYGEVSTDNSNYTGSCFFNWGMIAAVGMSKPDMDNLPENDELLSIVDALGTYASSMTDGKTKAIGEKIAAMYLVDEDTAADLGQSGAQAAGVFMGYLSDGQLNLVADEAKPYLCKGLGLANTDLMSTDDIIRLKTFCLENVLRDDTGTVTDRTSAAELDDNDIRDLNNLLCGLEESDMSRLSITAITGNIAEMAVCTYTETVGTALLDRALEVDSEFLDKASNVMAAGSIMGYISDASALSSDIILDSYSGIIDSFKERKARLARRDVSFSGEVSEEQRAADNGRQTEIAVLVLSALTTTRSKRSLRRMKRATAYTCTELRSIDEAVTTLASEDLAAMDNEEFQDCMDFFGSLSDWDADQLSELVTQAKTALGDDVSAWTSGEIQEASSIVAGLTSSEIATLNLDSTDVLNAIGQHDLYDSAQLMEGFAQYLNLVYSDDASSLTASDLMSGGHFVCGATSDAIGDIAPANYRDAASYIGSLGSCEAVQLQAFATLAKDEDAFGDVSTWETSTISALGTVMGGLSSSEFGSLTEEQLTTISAEHIPYIPGSVLAGLSVEQIGYLSTAQAGAITEEQQMSFSEEQLDALSDLGVTTIDFEGDSAAGVTFSMFLMTLSLIISWL